MQCVHSLLKLNHASQNVLSKAAWTCQEGKSADDLIYMAEFIFREFGLLQDRVPTVS